MTTQTEALKLALESLEDGEAGHAAQILREALAEEPAQQEPTYTSTQATNCAGCGEHKHTPLRIDAMGGYVCLTCIDKKLGSLLGEFGYAQPEREPVAKLGMYEHKCPNVTGHRGPSFVCQKAGHGVGQNSYCKGCTCPEALNTFPPQRNPLTDEFILSLHYGCSTALKFARAIEAAHGIKE